MGSNPLVTFNPATRAWFEATFQSPTRAQELAWPAIARGESALVLAPTGSGKTLAAFLAAIDRLMFSPVPAKPRTRILYISPLKALAVDVERNLREPLVGITRQAQRLGITYREPTVAIRTGDTPSRERARYQREPAEIPTGPVTAVQRSSIWPAIHPQILELIRSHRSTLIFVNSRRLAERLAGALNELAGEELVLAHHGSIAREQRLRIEDDLKSGHLPALVATSSLELGIDMGAIDLVIQVESPPSVASGMQRIGRAGHRIDEPSTGVIIPKYRGDLLASAAITEGMLAGAVEPLRYPRNPLDIVAQQVVAMTAMDDWATDDLERVIRRAAPFAELPRSAFEGVLDMLSGRYPSDAFAELRHRVVSDRTAGVVRSREGAKAVAISDGGPIPDRGLYRVFLAGAGGARVGELDEEMVYESRPGDV